MPEKLGQQGKDTKLVKKEYYGLIIPFSRFLVSISPEIDWANL